MPPEIGTEPNRNALDNHTRQRYCCVTMIPALVDIGGPFRVLPPGIHKASLHELKSAFAYNSRRRALYKGLEAAVRNLRAAGCASIFVDGSFVTDKIRPGDYDVCWDAQGVDDTKLDKAFLDFSDKRKRQKEKYGGEFFPSHMRAAGPWQFIDYFQHDKHTGDRKGIVLLCT